MSLAYTITLSLLSGEMAVFLLLVCPLPTTWCVALSVRVCCLANLRIFRRRRALLNWIAKSSLVAQIRKGLNIAMFFILLMFIGFLSLGRFLFHADQYSS